MALGFGSCSGPKAKADQRCLFVVVAVKSGSSLATQSANLRMVGSARRTSTSIAWRCSVNRRPIGGPDWTPIDSFSSRARAAR